MALEPVEPLQVPLRKSVPTKSVLQTGPQRTRSLPVRKIRPLPPIPTSPTSASESACQNSEVVFTTSRPIHALPPLPIGITCPSTPDTRPKPIVNPQEDDAASIVGKKHEESCRVVDGLVASPPRSSISTSMKKSMQRPKLTVRTRPISQMSAASSLSTFSLSIPRPPTPTTARKKRMSKLRRHLGREVPDETAFVEALQKANLNSSSEHGRGEDMWLLEKNGNRDSWQKRAREKTAPLLTPLTPLRPSGSATCYREKRGFRWEESNHTAVLKVLRRL